MQNAPNDSSPGKNPQPQEAPKDPPPQNRPKEPPPIKDPPQQDTPKDPPQDPPKVNPPKVEQQAVVEPKGTPITKEPTDPDEALKLLQGFWVLEKHEVNGNLPYWVPNYEAIYVENNGFQSATKTGQIPGGHDGVAFNIDTSQSPAAIDFNFRGDQIRRHLQGRGRPPYLRPARKKKFGPASSALS